MPRRCRAKEERGDTLFVPPNDDELGTLKARSAPAMFAPPICRRSRRNASKAELIRPCSPFVGCDEDGGCPANIAASGAPLDTASLRARQSARRLSQTSLARHGPWQG